MIRLRLEIPACLVACLAGTGIAGSCPDARDLDLLRNLNHEAQFGLAALQGELFLRQAGVFSWAPEVAQGVDSGAAAAGNCLPMPGIQLETGRALYHLGEFARVRESFRSRVLDPDPSYRRYYFESHFLDSHRPDLADSVLAFLGRPDAVSTLALRERKLYGAAALYLRGDLSRARADWPLDLSPERGREGMETGETPRHYLDIGYKQPWLGAWLSAVPGGGYLYAAQPDDGMTALAAVSVLYGVAAFYLYQESPLRGYVAAALGGVFHLSSAYGGYRAVQENNRKRQRSFLKSLHPHLP